MKTGVQSAEKLAGIIETPQATSVALSGERGSIHVPAPKAVKDIFFAALDTPQAARAALLDDACSGDAALRRQVDAWLQMRVHVDKSPFALVERNEVRRCDQESSENPGRFFIAASH